MAFFSLLVRKRQSDARWNVVGLLAGVVSLSLLVYLAREVDWNEVGSAWHSVQWGSVVLALVALAAGVLLGAWRLQWLAHDSGHDVAYPNVLSKVCFSQLAGVVFFQIVGQLMMRGALIRSSGVPAATSVFLTLYERLIALVLLVAMAFVGALSIFGTFGIDIRAGGSDLLRLVIGAASVCVAAGLFAWGDLLIDAWQRLRPGFLIQALRNVAVTIGIQLCTLAAIVTLAIAFDHAGSRELPQANPVRLPRQFKCYFLYSSMAALPI